MQMPGEVLEVQMQMRSEVPEGSDVFNGISPGISLKKFSRQKLSSCWGLHLRL